ncbi:hypothetical protein BCR33DRAFT_767263 [Rhizoclosmatium globosum]|uniref:BTB domain-containing protein n=1 Tax=Rhizoclosmatium globosum TaxID=329046 RepID=A0A1Y2C4C5_9FUNG|nr:hypothetical protein BCR33DRAFT_767263 [Rhizoclosmatium globosum]|eukprot:ORY41882.1 hypothetical protein BCR33DRAFT_767263 [Rhizoclosmatium globosum]
MLSSVSRAASVSSPTKHRRRPTVASLFGFAGDSNAAEPKEDVEEEIESTQRTNEGRASKWAAAFDSGLFSDVSVSFAGREFKLHRIVLCHAKLFDMLFSGSIKASLHSYTLDVAGSFVVLENTEECGIDPDSLEIALRDLYSPTRRSALITEQNVFSILLAACFIQTQELMSYCTSTILSTLSKFNIAFFTSQMDAVLSNTNTRIVNVSSNREFLRLRNISRELLLPHIESFLCHTVNTGIAVCAEIVDTEPPSPLSSASHNELYALLSDLPLSWFKFIIESPFLCVPDEFSRYQLLKRAAIYRWRKSYMSVSSTEESSKRGLQLPAKKMSTFFNSLFTNTTGSPSKCDPSPSIATNSPQIPSSLRGSVASFESSIFGSVAPSTTSPHLHPSTTSILSRLVNLYGQEYLRVAADASRDEETCTLSLFESAIVYTYMPFAHLERVKQDRIVSDSAVLTSFWIQAELINRFTTPFQTEVEVGFRWDRFGFLFGFRELLDGCWIIWKLLRGVRRLLLREQYQKDSQGDKGNAGVSKVGMQPPSLFRMNRSKSLDDLKGRTVDLQELKKGIEEDLLTKKYILKATLQRNRTAHGMSAVSSPSGPSQRSSQVSPQPISYAIYAFDPQAFQNGTSLVQKPITTCEFDGTGYIKGFAVPKGSGSSTRISTHSMSRTASQTSLMKQMRDTFKIRSSKGRHSGSLVRKTPMMGHSRSSDAEDLWLTVSINLFSS